MPQANPDPINWGALGVFAIFALAIGGVVRRGFASHDAMNARFTDLRNRARASLEANSILPTLAEFILDVAWGMPPDAFSEASHDDALENLKKQLQASGFIPAMENLERLARDHGNLSRLYDSCVAAGKRKAWSGTAALVALVVTALPLVFLDLSLTRWASVASWTVFGLATAGVLLFWAIETTLRNRLVALCENYEGMEALAR